MKFPLIHKKRLNHKKTDHKRLLLTDPNSLIGYRIDNGHIKLMTVLGVGGYGVVYKGVECFDDGIPEPPEPRHYAVKALSKVGLEPRQVRNLESEFELHTQVSGHPHIVTFHGIVEEDDFFFVLLDYVPGGDIFDMMELHRAYLGKDALIKSVFLQLIDAVEHIHSLGISHRDIKPENILCKDGGSFVMLADFGLGTNRRVVREYGLGSEPYMAPQCFGGFWRQLGPYSAPHADIWSLGVVLVNLACARNPWHKATEESSIYREFVNNSDYLMDVLPISTELNEVLKGMFTINPQGRISLPELRIKIQAIKTFTLTEEELRRANPTVRELAKKGAVVQKQPTLTPDAPHTAVVRQITNLTAEDIERLESDARHDAREKSLRQEQEAHRSLFSDAEYEDDDDDEDDYPLFMSPIFSPTPTVVKRDSTPRASASATLNVVPIFVINNSESDSESDVETSPPITPLSHPTADEDMEIAAIPEIQLDGSFQPEEPSTPMLSPNDIQTPSLKIKPLQKGQAKRGWWL